VGFDTSTGKFESLTEEQAKVFKKGPVFYIGEEIELKGITFVVTDIAPAQIKLKPKRV
jgi:hypothetical protein